ncbi:ABC transporter ATP-binding protein [Streptococcus merionis]|uniref:ABC transporter ATP-binding protein n=1 Tax=Streptococcus merionis TaxID=400065 RepID=UPI0035143BB4
MLKLLRRFTGVEVAMLLVTVVLVACSVWLDLELPAYMSEITTILQTPGSTVTDLQDPAFKMVGLSLASFAVTVVVGFVAARVAASFTTRLRSDVYHQVMDYSQAEIKRFSIPSLLTRTTNDLTQLQTTITMGLQVVTKGPMMALWAVTKIAGKSGQWLIAVGVAVAVVLLMLLVFLFLAFPKQRRIQGLVDNLNALTRESLTGIRVVRAYNAEDYQTDKFNHANDELTRLQLFVGRLFSLMGPVMSFVSSFLTLVIYWIGAHLISEAAMEAKVGLFADMVVFTSYGMQIIIGFMMMMMVFMILPRAMVSAGRINDVLTLDSSILYPEQTKSTSDAKGQVVFEDVSFRYSKTSEAVIEHVSFRANAGDTIAFIGSTGSGKSTLVNLIPRFYDATQGRVLVNGVNVKDYDQATLHNLVGYIPQKAVLFSGTVRSNMAMGESKAGQLTDSDIWEALELAQGKDFVQALDKGLDAEVAQNGTNFSGGQRQRLAIARALARKPEILIFDDSFSALDYQTDKVLRQALNERTAGLTKLIVAQRISTIMDADQILVLDQGKVVGQGTHRELLATNPIYQEIAYSQLSKEELEHGN